MHLHTLSTNCHLCTLYQECNYYFHPQVIPLHLVLFQSHKHPPHHTIRFTTAPEIFPLPPSPHSHHIITKQTTHTVHVKKKWCQHSEHFSEMRLRHSLHRSLHCKLEGFFRKSEGFFQESKVPSGCWVRTHISFQNAVQLCLQIFQSCVCVFWRCVCLLSCLCL